MDPEIKKHILSGAGAGAATSLVTCPLDVVKTRMQSNLAFPSPTNNILTNSLQFGNPKDFGRLSTLTLYEPFGDKRDYGACTEAWDPPF